MKCWNCNGDTMQPTGSFFTCSTCGATDGRLPKPGQSPLAAPEKLSKGSSVITNRARPSRKKAEKKS